MKRPRRNRPVLIALYANAALLAAILIALFSRGNMLPSASAAPMPQPIAGNGNLYLMPCQLLNNVWGCYVLDIDNQILCTYSYDGNQLKLRAARNIRYDHQLNSFNTSPDPDQIRQMVEIEQKRMHGIAPAGIIIGPGTQPATEPAATQPAATQPSTQESPKAP